MHQDHLEGLLKQRLLGPTCRISNLVGLEQGGELYLTISQMMKVLLVWDYTLRPTDLISHNLPGSQFSSISSEI